MPDYVDKINVNGVEYDLSIPGGAYSKPASGIPASDMTAEVQESLTKADNAVPKVEGKGLSTNDYDNTAKALVDALPVAIAGLQQDIAGKYTKPGNGIPASDLASGVIPDVSAFITKSVDDLVNYYLKSETYTKAEVQALIAAIQGMEFVPVSVLPTASADTLGKIYLVPAANPQTGNQLDEYYTKDNGAGSQTRYTWELFGSAAIDLSNYVTVADLNSALAAYTTTANLTTLLAGKQDTISDLATIRAGAGLGATAYQKPANGIPASDLASGVIPDVSGFYTKPSTGIPGTDMAVLNLLSIPYSSGTYTEQQFASTICPIADLQAAMEGQYLFARAHVQTGTAAFATDYLPLHGKSSPVLGLFQGVLDIYNGDEIIRITYAGPGLDVTVTVTTIPDVSGKEDTSNKVTSFGSTPSDTKYPTEKLVKDSLDAKQPTIDSLHKLPYSLISDTPTIPAAVEANPTVPSGTTPTDLAGLKVGNSYYSIPQLPTVDNTPTANSNNLVKSGGVYSEIHPAVASSQPAGGMLPNVFYNLGTLSGNTTFAFASATDNTIENEWMFQFTTPSTAPTITWPQAITGWAGGSAPTINESKTYQVSVVNGLGVIVEF